MAEYINREALLAEYDRVHAGPAGGARKLIEEAPAADVVPVVRCKDCRWRTQMIPNDYGSKWCGVSGMYPKSEDDFCSYGERKEAEDDV